MGKLWPAASPILVGRLPHIWAVEPRFTRERLRSIRALTLLIFGSGLVTPEHAAEMFRTIADA